MPIIVSQFMIMKSIDPSLEAWKWILGNFHNKFIEGVFDPDVHRAVECTFGQFADQLFQMDAQIDMSVQPIDGGYSSSLVLEFMLPPNGKDDGFRLQLDWYRACFKRRLLGSLESYEDTSTISYTKLSEQAFALREQFHLISKQFYKLLSMHM